MRAELEQPKAHGLVLASISLDRGYWDHKTLGEIEQTTGTRVYCPKKGKKSSQRAELEASEEFRVPQRFRVGIEGSLSVLVRRHAFRPLKGLGEISAPCPPGYHRHEPLTLVG